MDWFVLGIDATTDKDAITRAYRAKLTVTNPEEHPEAFKELRAAYEEALRAADEAARPATDLTPVQAWAAELAPLYDDLTTRTSTDAWRRQLSTDVVCALDTAPEAEEALLTFLADHYFLPQAVWQLLDDRFAWTSRAEELKEHYNPDFITYAVIAGIKSGERLPVSLFTPGEDGPAADRYVRLYNKLVNATREEGEPLLRELLALPEKHPYGECFALRSRIDDGDEATATEAEAELQALVAAHPGDEHLLLELATVAFNAGRYEECERLTRDVLAIRQTAKALRVLAEALARQGRYADAVEALHDVMALMDGNQKAMWELNEVREQWNNKLIEQYEAALAENPDDTKTRFDLAWCYIQNDRNADAYPLAVSLPTEYPDPFGYYNLLSNVMLMAGEHERALEYENALVETVRTMQPDGTAKTDKRIARLAEMILRRAETLRQLGRTDEALADIEEALATNPDNPETLTYAMQNYAMLRDFGRAADLADRLCEVAPFSYHGFLLKAIYNYELGRDGVAWDAVNEALDMDPSDLSEYHIKLLLLVRNNHEEEARELIAFVRDAGIADDLTVDWCEVRLDVDPDEDPQRALPLWQTIEERLDATPADEKPRWAAEFYYRLTRITADVKDAKEDYSRDDLLALLEKGLAAIPDDAKCTEYKAWLLKKEKRNAESIELFRKLADKPHRGLFPEKNLAELYYRDLAHQAPQALHYYEMLLADDDEDGDLEFYAGMCCYRMGRLEEAAAHFLAEIRKAPQDIDGYYRLAYVYLAQGRYPEALEQGRATIALAKKDTGDTSKFWHPAVCALRRMGLADAAVEALRECRQYNPDNTCYKTIFETYLQFGLFDKCEALLKEWAKDKQGKKDVGGRGYATLLLDIVQGRRSKARQAMAWQFETSLDSHDRSIIEAILQADLGRTGAAAKAVKKECDARRAASPDTVDTWSLNRYALALWADGQIEESRRVATESLAELDRLVAAYSSFLPLYHTRRAQCLAMLGRFDEATEALAIARSLPLCESCDFSACKDADVAVCRLMAIRGELDEAARMVAAFRERWPGEEDLPYLECIIRAKQKRQPDR